MAFKEKEVPANATRGQKMMAWIDSRFPLTATIEGHLTKYYAPKNFNFWYFFGTSDFGFGDSDHHRYFPRDALQA